LTEDFNISLIKDLIFNTANGNKIYKLEQALELFKDDYNSTINENINEKQEYEDI
jgi:hypothetical protein